ncbi:MAG: CRISPR-associated endonuclease Cas2 [Prosthecochloris sp.]|uniref:CRISPR-associated endonuclease Cas2 n=1 Tax=Prosthecochloris sp. TaxID=290513 RepID=UPI0013CA47CF|nr:CRISPR-associated endonuclease Cas2 [Prosthecochloris sp.]NEX12783.1 CRISPR-associated endonuclease Cas2 [Prosthecochloris sp.]
MFLLISYDIANNKRLPKVAKLMERYGERVQYSVFECLLTQSQLAELQRKLRRLIDEQEDSVRFYRLCEDCRQDIIIIGDGEITQGDEYYIA